MKITPIKLKRINAGINADKALKELNISKSMFYKIETGARSPSKEIIKRMSELYNCTIDDIFKALKI